MKTHEAELGLIKDLLRKNPKGIKITQVARELAMNRNAAAKYLEILLMTGQAEIIEHGMSKIFILSRRTGIPTMLDHSSDFILVLDKDLKIAEVNGNYLEFAGLDREDLLGKRADTGGFPVISSPLLPDKIRDARFGADIRAETREVLSGREFFFALRLTPTVFNDGSRGITIIITDITEIKKNEMMVRESEANFRILFGKSPVGTAVFDSAGKLMNGNPAFFATLGVQSPEGSPTMNLFTDMGIPPGSRDMLERGTMVKFAMPGFDSPAGKKHGHAARTDRADAIFEVNVTPVSQTSGEQKNGYLVQVTKNPVRSPGAVDTDHSLLAEILSCIEEAVILVDFPTGSISFVNRPAEKVFGFTAGEFLKKDPSRVLGHAGPFHKYCEALAGTFRQDGFFETESRLKRYNGEDFPAKLHLRPIYSNGSIRSIVMVIGDKSVRKTAAENPVRNEELFGTLPVAGLGFSGNRNPTHII